MIKIRNVRYERLRKSTERGLPYFTMRGWLAIAVCGALGGIAGGLAYGAMMAPFLAK